MKKTPSHTCKFFYKEFEISHTIKTKIKHSYISIGADSQIFLKTPKVSQKYLYSLLEQKEEWIRKKLLLLASHSIVQAELGTEVLLFGEIKKVDSAEAGKLGKKLSRMRNRSKENMQRAYADFLKELANEYITQRVGHFASIMSLEYSAIRYRKMKSRWGSCNSRKVLTFNTELMKLKKELIDYVVVHELAHLEHMNHSKSFHDLVNKYLKDSLYLRKELKNTRITTF